MLVDDNPGRDLTRYLAVVERNAKVQFVYLYRGNECIAGGLVHVAVVCVIGYVGGGRGEGVRAR